MHLIHTAGGGCRKTSSDFIIAGDLTWLDVSLLVGFADETMEILAQNERIEDRLPCIREALEPRGYRIATIREALGSCCRQT